MDTVVLSSRHQAKGGEVSRAAGCSAPRHCCQLCSLAKGWREELARFTLVMCSKIKIFTNSCLAEAELLESVSRGSLTGISLTFQISRSDAVVWIVREITANPNARLTKSGSPQSSDVFVGGWV